MLSGSRGIFFQEFGEINALFSGITGAQTPLGVSYLFCHFLLGDFRNHSVFI